MFYKGKVRLGYLKNNINQLKIVEENGVEKEYDITVEKIVELSKEDYRELSENLMKINKHILNTEYTHSPILKAHTNGVLFKEVGAEDGVFIVREKDGSAGNSAYIPEVNKLEPFGENMIKALKVEPNHEPYYIYLENSLEGLQEAVDGDIEVVYPLDTIGGLYICNENGKLEHRESNRPLKHFGKVCDVIAGTFIVVGDDGEEFKSVTEEQVIYYKEQLSLKNLKEDMAEYEKIVNYFTKGSTSEVEVFDEQDDGMELS